MNPCVLFRVAAGPRLGFGHLVRCRTIGAALGVRPVVSLRGTVGAARVAASLGLRLAGPLQTALRNVRPSLLVVDDPSLRWVARSIAAARRVGIATASLHDLGIALSDADLTIDGSIAPGRADLASVRFAVLDRQLMDLAPRRSARFDRPTVVVAFGGGSRRRLTTAVARAIARRCPEADVRVAYGFAACAAVPEHAHIRSLDPARGFRKNLASATVAVLAGGVTLYEACALGVPAVGVSIVRAQRKAVAGLARQGAVIDGGRARSTTATAVRIARLVVGLLDDATRRKRLSRAGRQIVDGRGATRVAAALRALINARGRRAA